MREIGEGGSSGPYAREEGAKASGAEKDKKIDWSLPPGIEPGSRANRTDVQA